MGSDIKELTKEALAQISLNHLWHSRIHCVVTVQQLIGILCSWGLGFCTFSI